MIVIVITLQQDIIFSVNNFITSNAPCNVSNVRRYITPSVLVVVVFVGLVLFIAWP